MFGNNKSCFDVYKEIDNFVIRFYHILLFITDGREFRCDKCKRIMAQYYISNCNHKFCKECEEILNGMQRKCDRCKVIIEKVELANDAEFGKQALQLKVKCPITDEDCEQEGTLFYINEHVNCLHENNCPHEHKCKHLVVKKETFKQKSISQELSNYTAHSSGLFNSIKDQQALTTRPTSGYQLNGINWAANFHKVVNILLVGETGVGKSTLINAINFYLQSEPGNLDKAKNNPLNLLISCKTVIVEKGLRTRIIQFGNEDANENTNSEGQSSTVNCKVHEINVSNNSTLRFIDTPGLGDVRGKGQDEVHTAKIAQFTSQYEQIHFICILLKCGEARIHPHFREYIEQLLKNHQIGAKFLFIFTNSRSTLIRDGNGLESLSSILREVKQDSPRSGIVNTKENTYFFDNEIIRYLIALKNQVQFATTEIEEIIKSWQLSLQASTSLINYVFKS